MPLCYRGILIVRDAEGKRPLAFSIRRSSRLLFRRVLSASTCSCLESVIDFAIDGLERGFKALSKRIPGTDNTQPGYRYS